MATQPIIVIEIEKARQFESFGFKDDREGLWYVDMWAYKADDDGEYIESLKEGNYSFNAHSGLHKAQRDATFNALEKARSMVRVLRACNKKAFLVNRNSAYEGDDLYLGHYLSEEARKAERQAKARTLRERAKVLLEQAKAIA